MSERRVNRESQKNFDTLIADYEKYASGAPTTRDHNRAINSDKQYIEDWVSAGRGRLRNS